MSELNGQLYPIAYKSVNVLLICVFCVFICHSVLAT